MYVLQVSCYRTCAVFIKCPKCSGYVKGSGVHQLSKSKEKCIACIYATTICPAGVLLQDMCSLCPKCSGYAKGTSIPE